MEVPVVAPGGITAAAGCFDQCGLEQGNNLLVYTSPPLGQSLHVFGHPKLVLFAVSSRASTDFVGKLVRVRHDGRAEFVSIGIARSDWMFPEGFVRDEPMRWEFELEPTSCVFAAGERLRLEIASSAFPLYDRNPGSSVPPPEADPWTWLRATQSILHEQGKPSAFSSELVGKYSEEIDLQDYLAVRGAAVKKVAAKNLYAGLLVSMHTYDLLQNRADHRTIAVDRLPSLQNFLRAQQEFQLAARKELAKANEHSTEDLTEAQIFDNFHLLQACDNLSLLTCVDYSAPANLLHALPVHDGGRQAVDVKHLGQRHFRLDPYPFAKSPLSIHFPARLLQPSRFASSEELREKFNQASVERLGVTVEG